MKTTRPEKTLRQYADDEYGWEQAWSDCREANTVTVVMVGAVKWKLFPSGHAKRWHPGFGIWITDLG